MLHTQSETLVQWVLLVANAHVRLTKSQQSTPFGSETVQYYFMC